METSSAQMIQYLDSAAKWFSNRLKYLFNRNFDFILIHHSKIKYIEKKNLIHAHVHCWDSKDFCVWYLDNNLFSWDFWQWDCWNGTNINLLTNNMLHYDRLKCALYLCCGDFCLNKSLRWVTEDQCQSSIIVLQSSTMTTM